MTKTDNVDAAIWVLAKAIALYYNNVSAITWANDFQAKLLALDPGRSAWHPLYADEQMEKYSRGFALHFVELDFNRQRLQIQVIINRYGAEARHEWDTISAFAEGE